MTTADKGITSRFLSALTGAVRRTLQSKAADSVNIKDFGAVCDGTTDDTAAWVAAIAACSSNTQSQSKTIRFNGSSKITSSLTISKQYIQIEGESPYASKILFNGVAGGCIKLGGQQYLRAVMRNFSIEGDASSGIGLDLSGVTSQVYSSIFENLFIKSGGTAFSAPGNASSGEFFNNFVNLVHAYSFNSHAFHVQCGPGTVFQSCYAVEVPAGKAGYRMGGIVNLIGCNGLNEGDVWGAFGSDPGGSDGFQGDFGFADYPAVTMVGCNVERFGSRTTNGIGLRICNAYRDFNVIGGAIQRADADIPLGANSYKAILSCKTGSNQSGNPIKFGPSLMYLRDVVDGTGTNTPSQAHFYFEAGGHLEDTNLVAEQSNITTYKVQADGPLSYPTIRSKLVNDIYGGFAQEFRAISPRRLSLQTTRYATGAVITPVGTNQAIDVTGRSKVVVTPAAAASISTATFTTTPADPVGDFGRNGELVIEAGNANLTIKHAASGANTFNITSGADLVLGAGDVVQFLRSEVGGNWRQIGGTSSGSSGAGQTYVTIFHNPFFDIYGAVDPTVGPPVGMTTPGSAVEETVTVYGGNPTAQSVRVTTSGTAIANGCTITPTIQPWGDPGSVSITIPVYATSNAARRVVVHGYNGVSYTLIGETSVISSWNLIKGTFTPIVGNNWSIVVSIWDGATYYSGWQFYVGGINIVKGVTPANTLEDSLGRRSYMVIAAAAPSRAPDFTGERWWDSAGSKFYVANGQTAVGNWIMLN